MECAIFLATDNSIIVAAGVPLLSHLMQSPRTYGAYRHAGALIVYEHNDDASGGGLVTSSATVGTPQSRLEQSLSTPRVRG